jgi:hypothetical protein
VGSLAFGLFVLNDAHTLYVLATVNAWHVDIGTNCLMTLNFFSNTFGFTVPIGFAFNRGKLAVIIMRSHLLILEHLSTAHAVISALKLHLLEFLFDIFFNT